MTPDKQPANELQASDQMHQAPGGEISPLALPVADRIKMNATAVRSAYITTFGFFALIFCLIALDRIPGANQNTASSYRDILLTLMGIVGTAWAGIMSFFFGSSVGSRQQSDTLQDISRGAVRRQ
jgi:hypothetical protein